MMNADTSESLVRHLLGFSVDSTSRLVGV